MPSNRPPPRVQPNAEIIAFSDHANRFTTADRAALLSWEMQGTGVRLAIHQRRDDDPPEVGEFASIYQGEARWAAWGAARQGRAIRVWRAGDGRDIGHFATMREALAAVTGPAAAQRRR